MTNTQHEALMAELREVRTTLDRFCARVDSMLGPMREPYQSRGDSIPAEVRERADTLGPVVDGMTGERAGGLMVGPAEAHTRSPKPHGKRGRK